jgi:hypothetical protein
MDLQSLANLSEVIGSVVVVLSLIYLAVQVRQNTEAQRAENYSRALDRLAAMQSILSQGDEISLILSKGTLDTSKLTPQERIRFTWFFLEAFGAYEFMFHASRTDAIPEEVWTRWSSATAWWLTFPGVQAWWHATPIPFTKSFTTFVDSLIEYNPTDAEVTRRFQDFITQGKSKI